MSVKKLEFKNQTIEISHKDKKIFPKANYTKEDVVKYYDKIYDTIEEYIKNRPIMMQRFPDGIHKSGFYQKQVSDYFPDWIDTLAVKVKKENKEKQDYVNCNSQATLAYIANQGCVTVHAWLSTKKNINKPDKMIFDLDPPNGADFDQVRKGALKIKKILDDKKINTFVMTTGSRGLHLMIPLKQQNEFDAVRKTAKKMAEFLEKQDKNSFTTATRKNKREGKLFLDYLRNSFGQTAVVPYSLRPIEKAPVATPLDWKEVSNPALHAQRYNLGNIFQRLGQKVEPWKDLNHSRITLDEINKKLK